MKKKSASKTLQKPSIFNSIFKDSNTKEPASGKKSKAHEPFEVFIKRMLDTKKLSPELLTELLGKEAVNRILDNANNWIGAPSSNESGTPVLQGQLHEYLGAIPDLKARISQLMEETEKVQEQEQEQEQTHGNLSPPK
jgi:hypothetical protein